MKPNTEQIDAEQKELAGRRVTITLDALSLSMIITTARVGLTNPVYVNHPGSQKKIFAVLKALQAAIPEKYVQTHAMLNENDAAISGTNNK